MSPTRRIRSALAAGRKAVALARRLRQGAFFRQLAGLEIAASGLDGDGTPFVELAGGPRFHGYPPTRAQRFIYRYLTGRRTKAVLPEELFGVAFDIVMRYLGPPTREAALAESKYYDLEPGETVIEVGAYMGFYAQRAAELVGAGGRVVAVEAIPQNAELIEKNIAANGLTNLTLVPEAAWSSPGELTFTRRSRQLASAVEGIVAGDERQTVRCATVDGIVSRLGLERVDLVRIQVNGAELEVLEGMPETLARHPRLLIAAIYDQGGEPAWLPIEAKLHACGYATRRFGGSVFAWREPAAAP